jgi:Domain of Unknown Function (DUF928)
MKLKQYIISCFCLCLAAAGNAQVSVSFNAAIYGQSLEGLSFARITNTSSEAVTARITIRVRELVAGNVVTVTIPSALIRQGAGTIDRVAFANARFAFGNNDYGVLLSQSGRFLEGEYEFCFEVELLEPKSGWVSSFFEQCFVQQVQPMTPLLLINPVDGDIDCNTRPNFIWQPPLPLQPDTRFRLVLTELKDRQDVIEAINFNLPVLNQGDISGNQLRFPFNAPPLKEGKTYVWQVIAYNGKIIVKRSEIWTYTVKCEEVKKEIAGDSYREIKETDDGNFYVASKVLRFSFNNPYSISALDYSISSLAEPDVVIKNLPKLQINSGLNKYDIDLSDNKAFKNGQEYLLKVRVLNNRELRLRFIYKNE